MPNVSFTSPKYSFAVFIPVLVAAAIYLGTTTNRGVIDYDEGYYAQAALHMARSGDWITPYANGVRFLEKPPLMYWVTALSFLVFGANEFALRLPSALAVITLVWLVTLMGRRAAGERAGVVAGLCIATSVGTFLFTREALHDIWLVLFVTLALYSFFEWHFDPRHSTRHALVFYASLAGAVLCKSLIGLAFPIGIVALFYALMGERPEWKSMRIVSGLGLFLALTLPWHWLAATRNRGFLEFFFVGEQFLRFFEKRDPPVLWSVPLLTFWALILVWFFPWTAFLPASFAAGRQASDKRQRALFRLSLAWLAVILGFFSFSSRLEHYAFPVLPAMALMVGTGFNLPFESRAIRWGFRGLAVLGVAALAVGTVAGLWVATSGHGLQFGERALNSRLTETDFSILADMPPTIIRQLVGPAVVTVAAMAAGFLLALWFEVKHRRMRATACVVVVMAIVCGMVHWSLTICEELISSKQFALAVKRQLQTGDRLVVMGDYESANSLSFYQPLPVEVYSGVAYALIPGMKYSDAPRIVLTQEEFEAAWRSGGRVFALLPGARAGELSPAGAEVVTILDRVLVRNH